MFDSDRLPSKRNGPLSHFAHPRVALLILEGLVLGFVGFGLAFFAAPESATVVTFGHIALAVGLLTALLGLIGYGYLVYIRS